MSETQKSGMEEFVRRKRMVLEAGSWKEEDFIKLEELGFGNGGMVLKVRHRVTEIVMARKVSRTSFDQRSQSVHRS